MQTSEVDPFAPCAGRVRPPRSHLKSDAAAFSLNGTWDFSLFAGGTTRTGAMGVPGHWVLADDGAWGRPIYTNVQYPFPVDPPFVPDDGPVGTYRRTFELPADWPSGGRRVLRLLGVESQASVTVNGVWIGLTRGSRLTREFDLTGVVRTGANEIVIEVAQWSPASYLEDQDQWWLPGIFRDVEVLHRPDGGVEDVWLRADFDPASGRGSVRPELISDAPARLRIAELGVDVELQPGENPAVDVGAVEPWNAEVPRLYSATVATASETVSLTVGFRRTSIENGRWLVNGRPLTWLGVNRHEVHRTRGRVYDEAWVRADLALMKAHNINAIRTSHYPPHPGVLALADELGFYVMLENDYESHGFEIDGWTGSPSVDPQWKDALLDRMTRTVERDKNHACVVSWSLGNEAYTGANLAAMAAWTRDRDPSRPIHYEGDHAAAYTDIYSRMYPTVAEVALVVDEASGPVAAASHLASKVTEADAARIRTMPYFLCEYAHAMGTGPGGLADYLAAFGRGRHAGGCVWEWRDHALDRRLPSGELVLGYGGDFGEDVHDGNFVCDGLVDADSSVSMGLVALANGIAPVIAEASATQIVVRSRFEHATASGLRLAWHAVPESGIGISDVVALPDLAPGASEVVDLPAGPWRQVTAAVLDPSVPGVAASPVRGVAPALAGVGQSVDALRTMSVRQWVGGPAAAAGAKTADAEASEMFLKSLRPTLFRGPTDNDRGGRPSSADVWAEARLGLLEHRLASDEPGRRVWVSGVPSRQRKLTTTLTWTPTEGGRLAVEASFEFAGDWPNLPRIGLAASVPGASGANVTWTGLGPTENYPDLTFGCWQGEFAAPIEALWGRRVRPQEAGHRGDCTALTIAGSSTIELVGEGFGFSLCPWTPQQLDAAPHVEELPASTDWWLTIDARHAGVGTASCGPATDPRFLVQPESATLAFRLGVR